MALATRHPVAKADTHHVAPLAFAMPVHVELGLLGLHALAVQELELEPALLVLFAQHLKQKLAVHGIVQQALILTALVVPKQ